MKYSSWKLTIPSNLNLVWRRESNRRPESSNPSEAMKWNSLILSRESLEEKRKLSIQPVIEERREKLTLKPVLGCAMQKKRKCRDYEKRERSILRPLKREISRPQRREKYLCQLIWNASIRILKREAETLTSEWPPWNSLSWRETSVAESLLLYSMD